MADIKITNGALVHRLWSDNSTELVAHFQYDLDAKLFVAAKVPNDAEHGLSPCRYTVTCLYSGKMEVFSRASLKEEPRP